MAWHGMERNPGDGASPRTGKPRRTSWSRAFAALPAARRNQHVEENDKFVWTASKVDYAATVPDDDNKTKKPSEDGKRFCLITTTVKNVSSADQDIAALDFEIVDGTGDENTAVGLLTGDPGFPFATQTQLPTGTEKTVQMVFEVPDNVKATDLVVGGDFTKPGTGFKIALG